MKIPFLNRFITDDQEFYEEQINEELKYCNSSNYTIKFIDVGKNRRAFVIKTKEKKTIILFFMKYDYKGINKALEKIRLNLALVKKENLLDFSIDGDIILDTSSKNEEVIEGENGEKNKLIISTVEELVINNNSLREKEDIIKSLLDLSIQNDKDEPYLDFYKAGYDAGIQNYLMINLYKENISLNARLVTALHFYKMKEPKFYYLVNSLLRGNFDEMFSYLNTLERPMPISGIVKICKYIIQAQEELPNRNHDLMIYRMGLGVNKDKTIGAQNLYESFVSFGTSGGIMEKPTASDSKPIIYKRILKKDEKAVPVDLIENIGVIYLDGKQENELLLQPFAFKITDVSQDGEFDVYSIEETKKINPRELLDKRLDELEEYLKNKNDIEQCEEIKQLRGKITEKAKRTNTVYNIKDIYYGLRPKIKNKKINMER